MKTTTTTTKPKTFMEAVRALVAYDIAAGNFEILELEENGKYGHGKFLFTGTEDNNEPYNYTIEFTLEPGEIYADVSVVDYITNETLNTVENLHRELY